MDWAFWRRYLGWVLLGNLAWESLQLPLYAVWQQPLRERVFAVAHCTVGDVLIAAAALLAALVISGNGRWPMARFGRVAALATVFGATYTVFSEWLNVVVRQSWAYSELMPRLPPLGTGLAPVLQWLVVPPVALWAMRLTLDRAPGSKVEP
jgi:hypothetical protein